MPIELFNEEVIFVSNSDGSLASNTRAKVDTNLYKLYAANDVRQTAFFLKNADNSFRFKGSYNEGSVNFNGIATDEILLIRAECLAREGATVSAMQDLNSLLIKRYKAPFVAATATGPNDALMQILNERRKELLFRELRWSDLRRLNKEAAFAVTLTRNLNNQLYTLPANDLRYTMLIPVEIMRIVDLPQNPR